MQREHPRHGLAIGLRGMKWFSQQRLRISASRSSQTDRFGTCDWPQKHEVVLTTEAQNIRQQKLTDRQPKLRIGRKGKIGLGYLAKALPM